MSYDDGKLEDERLVAIFNKYGIKGTFNLNYGVMLTDTSKQAHPRLPLDRVKTLYEGYEIASHSLTHPTIARCPMPQIVEELVEDRKGLEEIAKKPVRGFAYPNGSYNEEIKKLYKMLGVDYARVTESAPDTVLPYDPILNLVPPEDPMEWHPTCHHDDPKLMEFAKEFVNFKKPQYLKLMYVWGHSYEFEEHHNWKVIEDFCEFVGGRDDIWYATNIEIIDYLNAAKGLRFSANYHYVENPYAMSVWLSVNDEPVELKGGTITNLDKV